MIWEILSPWAPSSPMIEPDSCRTIAAGSKVTNGREDRPEDEQQQHDDEQDRQPWVRLPVVLDCFCWATLVATTPARWNCRPGGAPTFAEGGRQRVDDGLRRRRG